MTALRRVLLSRIGPDIHAGSVLSPLLTGVGVFTFFAGVLYMPTLGPTRVEMIVLLLLLAAVALLCTAVGQLAAVLDRLDRRKS
jgi:hypothetical protein